MGNNPSRSSSTSNHPHSTPQSPASHGAAVPANVRKEPQRRGSVQALSTVSNVNKATPAPPSASLESTTAAFANGRATHSRSRSHTTNALITSRSLLQDSHSLPAEERKMGNESSKEKAHAPPSKESKEKEMPARAIPIASPARRPSPLPAISSQPLDVPAPALSLAKPAQVQNDPHFAASYIPQPVQYSQPPRVPLPIASEIHTPGSPIITPGDLTSGAPIEQIPTIEEEPAITRDLSVLSHETNDDDSVADEWLPTEHDSRDRVATLIEWRGKGDKVYVTGTFADWDRKFKLTLDGPSADKDVLSTFIYLIPGTHHVKFIVDGDMQVNEHLPTTVDFTNSLVNYVEVSPDLVLKEWPADGIIPPDKIFIPGGVHPIQSQPVEPKEEPVPIPEAAKVPEPPADAAKPTPVVQTAPKKYHTHLPRYLKHLDEPEDSEKYSRANQAIGHLPTPPSLPQFLSRSILNGQTPMKDDNSVLIMPNHTVLNHLATSSIRSHVLATSATIRYKRKFLTTIMYKPTSDTGTD